MGGIAGVVAVDLQQFDFATQRCQVGLLGGIGLAQIADFIAAGFQLGNEAFLGQLRHGQALFEQLPAGHARAQTPLKLPAHSE